MAPKWEHSQSNSPLPKNAIVGGHDSDGTKIYVGRAFHDGELLPAKVIPSKGCAYVPFGGGEHVKTSYEILVGKCSWRPCHGGEIPKKAFKSGHTRGGESLYVGRGYHANSLCVGKVHPSHGCLYIPYGGMEIKLNTFEIMCD